MKHVLHHHIDCAKAGVAPSRGRTKLFEQQTPDDEWMGFVGARQWIVLSQDYKFHREPAVASVIKQHGAKVFYLWGADRPKREVMRVLLNSLDKIERAAEAHAGPFIFRVPARGALQRVSIEE